MSAEKVGKATQDGYDWPNEVQDERWPADKYQPASEYWREQLEPTCKELSVAATQQGA